MRCASWVSFHWPQKRYVTSIIFVAMLVSSSGCRCAGNANDIFAWLPHDRLVAHAGLPESPVQHSLPCEGITEGGHDYAEPRPGLLGRLTGRGQVKLLAYRHESFVRSLSDLGDVPNLDVECGRHLASSLRLPSWGSWANSTGKSGRQLAPSQNLGLLHTFDVEVHRQKPPATSKAVPGSRQ